nr:MAG TPA: hypothetical protein [Caudoviricetes sp.]
MVYVKFSITISALKIECRNYFSFTINRFPRRKVRFLSYLIIDDCWL